MKTEEIATLRGDESPKKSAISLPDENPAPIAVPIYNAAVLNDFFTRKSYENNGKIMINYSETIQNITSNSCQKNIEKCEKLLKTAQKVCQKQTKNARVRAFLK